MNTKDVIAQAEIELGDLMKFHPLNEIAWEYTKEDIQIWRSTYTKDLLQSVEKEIAGLNKSENSNDYDFGGENPNDRKHNEMRGMDNVFGFNQGLHSATEIIRKAIQ
jgi:hypothetical protein